MKKDPYYTYTDYWPARPAKPKISRTILVLVICAVFLLPWLMFLKGGL